MSASGRREPRLFIDSGSRYCAFAQIKQKLHYLKIILLSIIMGFPNVRFQTKTFTLLTDWFLSRLIRNQYRLPRESRKTTKFYIGNLRFSVSVSSRLSRVSEPSPRSYLERCLCEIGGKFCVLTGHFSWI